MIPATAMTKEFELTPPTSASGVRERRRIARVSIRRGEGSVLSLGIDKWMSAGSGCGRGPDRESCHASELSMAYGEDSALSHWSCRGRHGDVRTHTGAARPRCHVHVLVLPGEDASRDGAP